MTLTSSFIQSQSCFATEQHTELVVNQSWRVVQGTNTAVNDWVLPTRLSNRNSRRSIVLQHATFLHVLSSNLSSKNMTNQKTKLNEILPKLIRLFLINKKNSKIINYLNIKKLTGNDEIRPTTNLNKKLCEWSRNSININFQYGCFPEYLKLGISKIKPISYKGGDKNKKENYSPIETLSLLT